MSSIFKYEYGSIYSHDKIVEELGFIIRTDDSEFVSIKVGETRPLVDIQLPKDTVAQELGLYDSVLLFSFGETLTTSVSKEDQVKIANFLIEYPNDHRLKHRIVSNIRDEDVSSLRNTFDDIVEFYDTYS